MSIFVKPAEVISPLDLFINYIKPYINSNKALSKEESKVLGFFMMDGHVHEDTANVLSKVSNLNKDVWVNTYKEYVFIA